MRLYHRLGVSTPFDSRFCFVTSPFFSSFVFAGIRLALAAFTLITLLVTLIWGSVRLDNGSTYFSYFTHLSYIGVCAYFWASGTQTLVYAVRRGKRGVLQPYPLQQWPAFLQFFHVLLYVTITVYPIIVTVVFWALLADSSTFNDRYSAWSNVSMHILNAACALFEILLTHIPPLPWLHMPIGFLILVGYLGVAYITHESQGIYPYAFLDPHKEKGLLAAYIVGIAIGYCLIFSLVHGLACLRLRFTQYISSSTAADGDLIATPEALDEWQEIAVQKDVENSI